MTSRANRERAVGQMLANLRLVGAEPDDQDAKLLEFYVEGTLSMHDLLMHARQFATAAAYEEWLIEQARASTNKKNTSLACEQLMIEMHALIRRKQNQE